MTGTFLTSDELRELTGYKRPSDQVNWLREHGVPHGTRADGSPVLTLRVFEETLLRDSGAALPEDAPRFIDHDFMLVRHNFVVDPMALQRWLPGDVIDTGPGVYFIFHDRTLVYVGKARDLAARIYSHTLTPLININPEMNHRVAFISVPESHIGAVESYYLVKFRPPMNAAIPRRADRIMADLL